MSSFLQTEKMGERKRASVWASWSKEEGGGVCRLVERRGRALRWLSINR